MPIAAIPFILLVLPVIEIATFILVGNWIGLLPTLGLVVVSAVLGVVLLRRQGLSTLRRIQIETANGRVPGRELVHGVMIVAAGILLLTPGLVTDVFGYLLFIPAVRDVVWRFLGRRVVVGAGARFRPSRTGARDAGRPAHPAVVELEREEFERRSDPSSPWNGSHDGNRTLH